MSHLQWNSPKYVLERKIYSLSSSLSHIYVYVYENGLKTIVRIPLRSPSAFKKFFNKKNLELSSKFEGRCLETHTNPSILPLSYPYREWAEM